ncbi:hypothetical protein KGF54_001312 [Candida jiufengensis]|uniref:uncharacterized protein n=1 Tax=Candida jiufengensis TaxID=497108 RepID=UPI002223FD0E|nr:uncharacterized protein KGF54_001312 [Candida jiufengensis]KAI5955810.1 hypothetical protein KGF54_001312 [Candida jiufengensis]
MNEGLKSLEKINNHLMIHQQIQKQNQLPSPNSPMKYGDFKNIGRGNFGDVYRATDYSSKPINGKPKYVALKVINMDDSTDDMRQIFKEIQFLFKLRHDNVVKYIKSFAQESNLVIVMEYCGGGSCSDLIKYHKKLSESIVSYIIRQVLLGLSYLHDEHKVHRDIKSANILLTDDAKVKIGDFGVSSDITLTKLKKQTFVGTPFWMAPEVITRGSNNHYKYKRYEGYDYKADVWSLGITVIEMITGAPPLSEYDPLKIIFEIPKRKSPELKGNNYSNDIKDFVKQCCCHDPEKRPNCKKLIVQPFVKKPLKTNEIIKNELIKLIVSKNAHLNTRNRSKPRHKLNLNLNLAENLGNKPLKMIDEEDNDDNNKNKIEWEFTRTFQAQMDKENNTPYTKVNNNNNKIKTESKLKNLIFDNELNNIDVKLTKNDIEEDEENKNFEIENSFNESKTPYSRLIKLHQQAYPNQPKYQYQVFPDNDNDDINDQTSKKSIFFQSLNQVLERGKDETTQKCVLQLIQVMNRYELNNPGLCHALVEEIEKLL